jgi:predicted nucleotidyltransferase
MNKLDARTEQTIEKFSREIRTLYGDDLISLVLYGSAAGADFVPDRSDLNFLVVLKEVTPEALRKAVPLVRDWHRWKIATPLFIDPDFLRASLDLFPIEFSDMQEQHRVLAGQDLLLEFKISPRNLRLQCEEELKGKLLHLRRAYLETGSRPEALEELIATSVKSFLVITRHLLRLKGLKPAHEFLEALVQIEEAFGTSFEAIRDAHSLRLRALRLEKSEATTLFDRYLADIEDLAACAETLFRETQ